MTRAGAVVVVLLGVLAVVAVAVFALWDSLADVAIGWRGYLAMFLGVGFSLLVGCGLMALVFLSSRRGYDDVVGRAPGVAPPDDERNSRE